MLQEINFQINPIYLFFHVISSHLLGYIKLFTKGYL